MRFLALACWTIIAMALSAHGTPSVRVQQMNSTNQAKPIAIMQSQGNPATPLAEPTSTTSVYLRGQWCIDMARYYQMIPTQTWGSAHGGVPTKYQSQAWGSWHCDCFVAADLFGIIPTVSWGTAPQSVQQEWQSAGVCDADVVGYRAGPPPIANPATPLPEPTLSTSVYLRGQWCVDMARYYQMIPTQTWGSAHGGVPTKYQPQAWGSWHCDCFVAADLFGIIPTVSWGTAPQSVQQEWQSAGVCDADVVGYRAGPANTM